MSRGINSVVVSGNVAETLTFSSTGDGTPVCGFRLACDRKGGTTWVKVNAYGPLVDICEDRLAKGGYVVVSGELMARDGRYGGQQLIEVRAREIVFC